MVRSKWYKAISVALFGGSLVGVSLAWGQPVLTPPVTSTTTGPALVPPATSGPVFSPYSPLPAATGPTLAPAAPAPARSPSLRAPQPSPAYSTAPLPVPIQTMPQTGPALAPAAGAPVRINAAGAADRPIAPLPAVPAAAMPKAATPVAAATPAAPVPAAPAAANGSTGEQFITIREAGKAEQKCRVLRTWTTADGATAHEVQALDTLEIMTIVENGPLTRTAAAPSGSGIGSRLQAMTGKMFGHRKESQPTEFVTEETVSSVRSGPVVTMPAELEKPQAVATLPSNAPASKSSISSLFPHPAPPQASPCAPAPRYTSSTPVATASAAYPSTSWATSSAAASAACKPSATACVPCPKTCTPAAGCTSVTTGPSGTTSSTYPAATTSGASTSGHKAPIGPATAKYLESQSRWKLANLFNRNRSTSKDEILDGPKLPAADALAKEKSAKDAVAQAAEPSDWRKSWGKPESSPTRLTGTTDSKSSTTALPKTSTTGTDSKISTTALPKTSSSDWKTGTTALPKPATPSVTETKPAAKPEASATVAQAKTAPAKPEPVLPVSRTEPTSSSSASKPASKPESSSTTAKLPEKPATPAKPESSLTQAKTTPRPESLLTPTKAAAPKPELLPAKAPKPDPLESPAQYARRPITEIINPRVNPEPVKQTTETPPADIKPAVVKEEPKPESVLGRKYPVSPGTKSVLAAYDPSSPVYYLPVPMVTMPPGRPPAPTAVPPQPPKVEPTDERLVNAFSPPLSQVQAMAQAMGTVPPGATNAFTSQIGPNGEMPPQMAVSNPAPMGYAGAPMPMRGMYGYGPMPMPMYAQAYPQMYGQMYRPMPMPQMPQQMGYGAYPAVMPVAYQQRYPSPSQPAYYQPPADSNVQQTMRILREALYPSQREWAADALARVDWRTNPPVVNALVRAAQEDAAATVRAGCVRSLGRMHVSSPGVMETLHALKQDTDPRVRQEVDVALASLNRLAAAKPASTIQPVNATTQK